MRLVDFIFGPSINPVVALNSALGFIKPLPKEEEPLNQRHPLDQSNSDLWKVSSKWSKLPFYESIQLIQPYLYATTGLTHRLINFYKNLLFVNFFLH